MPNLTSLAFWVILASILIGIVSGIKKFGFQDFRNVLMFIFAFLYFGLAIVFAIPIGIFYLNSPNFIDSENFTGNIPSFSGFINYSNSSNTTIFEGRITQFQGIFQSGITIDPISLFGIMLALIALGYFFHTDALNQRENNDKMADLTKQIKLIHREIKYLRRDTRQKKKLNKHIIKRNRQGRR